MPPILSCAKGRVLLLCLLASQLLFSQTHTARTVTINSKCRGYWEYLPVNYAGNTTTKYPLIFYIHGGGSYGNGTASAMNIMLSYEGIPYYINTGAFPATFTVNGQTTSFIVISPQFTSRPTPLEIKQVIDYMIPRYRIDTTRIYCTGYSVGGDVAWKTPYNLSAAYRLAALAPVAGYNNPYYDTTARFIANSNLPTWAIHSNSDASIVVEASQNMVNKINSFNPAIPAIITRLTGVTHENTVRTAYDPAFRPNGRNMYEWFLQYSRNFPPDANAGSNVNIILPVNSVNLNGAASTDPENSTLQYSWSKISGPSAFLISNGNTATPTVSNLVAGVYDFRLVVTDNVLLTDTATVRVTVTNPNPNQLPLAVAGEDQQVLLPQTATSLIGSGSADPDGIIETYNWTKIAGPAQFTISTPNAASTSVSNLKVGTYRFKLTVTDNQNGVASDTVEVIVINPFPNILPVANAGTDQVITLPVSSATVNGSSSSDGDGNIIAYQWRQISGPAVTSVAAPNAVSTTVSNLNTAGVYKFELAVTDDSSAVVKDTMAITVNPPVRIIQVNIYGGSNPAGTGWYNWNVQTGLTTPALPYSNGLTSTVTASLSAHTNIGDNGTSYPTTMCPPEVGRYASYNTNASRTLTISGLDNSKLYDFEAYASRTGGNQTKYTVGNSSITITTDRNYANKALFTNLTPVAGKITITLDRITTYTYINGFKLTEITSGSSSNAAPVSVPGGNQFITLPASQVTLNGSASNDPDGSITAFNWQKLSGPSATISNPAQASTTVTGMTTAGVYVFQLTVTDNQGATASNTVEVTVSPQVSPLTVADSLNCGRVVKIVVLGSSTASGTGATPVDSSWVNKLRKYIISKNAQSTVVNLGLSGMTTYQILCPTGFVPPAGRPSPSINNNITYALSLNPDIIIINLPSNDAANDYTLQEQQDNYERTMALADARNIPVWVSTTQPRNGLTTAQVANLTAMRDWTNQRFGAKAIDFWTTLASATGTINSLYNYDGIHLNNSGHHILYTRTVAERMLDTICLRYNIPPIANAGIDKEITLPEDSVQLSGAGSDGDGTITAYNWSKVSGPAQYTITNAAIANPKLRNLAYGTYLFELKVTDNTGAIAKDTVLIRINSALPLPPVANAGIDLSTRLPKDSVQLSGAGSVDPDGVISHYQWNKISGPDQFSISDDTSVNPFVNNLTIGSYVFELVVTDSSGLSDKDSVTIQVAAANLPPVANAGTDNFITAPTSSIQLNSSLSADPDGTISSRNWLKVAGPASFAISNATVTNPVISSLVAGIYTIELTVTDNDGAIAKDSVSITVYPPPNTAPVAGAGSDQAITLPLDSVILNGSASSDAVGSIISYQWQQVSGPSASIINNPVAVSTIARGLIAGTYRFELTVTDDSSAVARDTIMVTVNAAPPPQRFVRVNIFGGSNPAGTGWNNWNVQTNLTSSAFTYADGGTSAITATLSAHTNIGDNGNGYPTTMCPPEVGRHASYNTNASRTLIISGLDNSKRYDFEAYASRIAGNQTRYVVGTTSITINTDRNYTNKALFTNLTPVAGKITVTLERITTYTYINGFTLTENGGGGTPVPNQPPVARAGNDLSMILPANSTTLSGSTSTDPDGTITSYSWAKVSGPASFTINNAAIANPLISNLVAGTYLMQLTVTDNNGASSMDSVSITVYPSLNTPPVARAGADQTITLPVNTVILNGSSSSDAVGQIVSYLWRQISGPSAGTLGSASTVSTTAANLITGAYQFELQVTDDSSAVGKDTVIITVNPVPPAQRFVRVNIFGGSNPAGTGWNNWNVQTSLSTGALSYSDGAASAITAALSAHTNIGDNGTGYPTTMCPPEVGRYASYNTNASRTLTISGLDNSKTYDFEAYASRIAGNPTRYVTGTSSITINTDRNYVNKAVFNNLTPVAGRITITLERTATYTYINGFMLTENSSTMTGRTSNQLITSTENEAVSPALPSVTIANENPVITLFPNPAGDNTEMLVSSEHEGNIKVTLLNENGRIAKEWQWMKEKGLFQKTISLAGLKKGIYLLQVRAGNWQQTKTIIKL